MGSVASDAADALEHALIAALCQSGQKTKRTAHGKDPLVAAFYCSPPTKLRARDALSSPQVGGSSAGGGEMQIPEMRKALGDPPSASYAFTSAAQRRPTWLRKRTIAAPLSTPLPAPRHMTYRKR